MEHWDPQSSQMALTSPSGSGTDRALVSNLRSSSVVLIGGVIGTRRRGYHGRTPPQRAFEARSRARGSDQLQGADNLALVPLDSGERCTLSSEPSSPQSTSGTPNMRRSQRSCRWRPERSNKRCIFRDASRWARHNYCSATS